MISLTILRNWNSLIMMYDTVIWKPQCEKQWKTNEIFLCAKSWREAAITQSGSLVSSSIESSEISSQEPEACAANIYLSSARLCSLPAYIFQSGAKYCYLSRNYLIRIPEDITKLTGLVHLGTKCSLNYLRIDISNNSLTNDGLPNCTNLSVLSTFDCEHNELK